VTPAESPCVIRFLGWVTGKGNRCELGPAVRSQKGRALADSFSSGVYFHISDEDQLLHFSWNRTKWLGIPLSVPICPSTASSTGGRERGNGKAMTDAKEPVERFADPPALRGRWTVCAMLFVATSINYMDRQVIAILKPVLAQSTIHLAPLLPGWPTVEKSISLSELQFGKIVFMFQIAYALGVIFAGRMIDKLGCRKGYPIATGIWSLAAMGHALVHSVFGFGVARFFLGLGESGNFPAAIKATAEWFPPKERSLATGIFNSGANVGAILAPAIVPWVAWHFGWRFAFLTTGLFSAMWIVWWSVRYRTPRESMDWTRGEVIVPPPGPQPEWWRFLAYRQTWGFMVAKFLTDPVWWFFLFWLPGYFSSRFNLNLSHLGLPLIVIYCFSTVGSVCGGWLPRGFERLSMGLKPARLAAMLTCACLVVPVLFAGSLHSVWGAVALLSIAASAHQGWSANLFTTVPDMFPHAHVGTVVSFGQVAGAAGGAIFAMVAGNILQISHSYVPLFLYSASAYLVALLLLRKLAPGLKRAMTEG
jgi:ACS family hexuronate transporter-like MFS transporter